jgi:MSHA biogenesis protein MshQ
MRASTREIASKALAVLFVAAVFMLSHNEARATIVAAQITQAATSTGSTTQTTAAFTPVSNTLYLMWTIQTIGSGPPTTPTVACANGLNMVQVNTVVFNTIGTPLSRLTLFRGMKSSGLSNGNCTISWGQTTTGHGHVIVAFTGADISGTDGSGAVAQSVAGATNNATAGAGLSLTLAALQVDSASAGGFSNSVNNTNTLAAGAGYTAGTGVAFNTPATSLRAEWDTSGVTTVNMTQSATSNIGGIAIEVLAAPPSLLAEYRMDEALWNGTAGEVLDNSGNGNDAQGFNGASTIGTTPAIPGNPGTCNYGVFDNGGTITQGYVQTPLPNLTTNFTITAWIRTTNNTVSGQRIVIDDENNTGGYGFSLGDGAAGILRFYSRGITPVILDSTYTIANNTWYFVAAVVDITNKKRTIYVFNAAGALLNTTTEAAWTGGAWGTDAGPVSIGGEVNGPPQSEPPASFHFHGNLDEVRVYQQALSQAEVTAIATQTHACPITSSVNHFLIDTGAATASTCTPKDVTISVLNALNNVVTNYAGTVNITTSPAHGDWSTVTAAGTLTPGVADSGAASYQFVAADNGVATLALTDQHADAALTVNVVDPLVPTSSTTSAAIAFSDNAFVITNDPVQVAGRPQAMSAAMWRKDPITGNCSVSPYYIGAKNLKAWLTLDISDPGGAAPKIGALSLPAALPGANNLALTFGAGSVNFNLSTTDVGKYALNLRDDSLSFGSAVINGSSNIITTRPFALVVSAIKQGATNNPANSAPGGTIFAKAGTGFQATVGAYRWNSAADTNVALGDGVPDAGATLAQITANGAAPSYTWPTTVSGNAPYTPAGGTLGSLNNGIQTGTCPAAAPNCFTSGIATPTNLSYAEVGSFTLGVAATSFLNTPGVDLTAANGTALVFDNTGARNGVVGRFIPDHFNTYVLSLSGLPMLCPTGLTCPVSYNGFVYSGEPFSAQIIAQNAANATTQNYDGTLGFSKAVTLTAWNAVGGATQNPNGGTFSSAGVASAAFSLGATSASVPAIAQNYSLPSVTAPTNIYIRAQDTDAVTSLLAIPANSVEGGVSVANGRLRLFNNFGSEKASLGLSVQAQFWSGKSWVLSSTDSATAIPATSVALSNYRDSTGAPTGSWTTSASGPGTLSLGQGTLTLSAPSPAGKTGCVDVAINLGTGTQDTSCLANHPVMTAPASSLAWLRGQNGSCAASTTYAADPSATACFGVYSPESARTIHVRELF